MNAYLEVKVNKDCLFIHTTACVLFLRGYTNSLLGPNLLKTAIMQLPEKESYLLEQTHRNSGKQYVENSSIKKRKHTSLFVAAHDGFLLVCLSFFSVDAERSERS